MHLPNMNDAKLEIKVKLIIFTKIEKVMTYLKEKSILLKLTVVR